MIAAYYERVGHLIMRSMDILFAFPMVLLAIMLSFFLGPGLMNFIIALVIVLVPYNTRVVYVQALAEREWGCPGRMGCGYPGLAHNVCRDVASRGGCLGGLLDDHRGDDYRQLWLELPWARSAASDRRMGNHDERGPNGLAHRPHLSTLPGTAVFLLVIGFNLLATPCAMPSTPTHDSFALLSCNGMN